MLHAFCWVPSEGGRLWLACQTSPEAIHFAPLATTRPDRVNGTADDGNVHASLGTPLPLLSKRAADELGRALSDVTGAYQVQCSETPGLPPAAGAPNGRPSFSSPPPRTSTATCGLTHLASRRNGSWRSSPGWLSFRSGPAPLRPLRGRQRRSRSFTRLCCPRPSTPTQCSETSSPRSCAQRERASWQRRAATASRRRPRRGGSPLTTPPSSSGLPASAPSRSPSPTAAPASPRFVSKTLTKSV